MSKISLPKPLSTALGRADELLSMMATARASIIEADAQAIASREAAAQAQAEHDRLLADAALNLAGADAVAAAANAVKGHAEQAAQAERLAAGLRARLPELESEAGSLRQSIASELGAFTERLFTQALSALEEAVREPMAKAQAIAHMDPSGSLVRRLVEGIEDMAGMGHPMMRSCATARATAKRIAETHPITEAAKTTMREAAQVVERLKRQPSDNAMVLAPKPAPARRSENYLGSAAAMPANLPEQSFERTGYLGGNPPHRG